MVSRSPCWNTVIAKVFGSHDYIHELKFKKTGKKFKSFKEWNKDRWQHLIEDVIGYADYVEKVLNDKDESPGCKVSEIVLDVGEDQLPILPEAIKGVRGSETADVAKRIIRAYFTRHYRVSSFFFFNIQMNFMTK